MRAVGAWVWFFGLWLAHGAFGSPSQSTISLMLSNAEFVVYGKVVKAVPYEIDDGIRFSRTLYLVKTDAGLKCVGMMGTPRGSTNVTVEGVVHPHLDHLAFFFVETGPQAVSRSIPFGYERLCNMYLPAVPGEVSTFVALGAAGRSSPVVSAVDGAVLTTELFGDADADPLTLSDLLRVAERERLLSAP